jgi:hypothetical protein
MSRHVAVVGEVKVYITRSSVLLPSNEKRIHGQTNRLLFDKIRTAWKMTRPALLLLRVFVTAGTCLPSRCLATIHIQTDGRDL